MSTLNPTQQKDLETYRKTGELGSLKNTLVMDCIDEFNHNHTSFENFHQICIKTQDCNLHNFLKDCLNFVNNFVNNKNKMEYGTQILSFILSLLSRTPDEKAVIPFLDVEIKKYAVAESEPKTLDHLLYREFTEALRLGKSLDLALEIITKTYVNHIYNNN